jgi:general secretion pathway protein E
VVLSAGPTGSGKSTTLFAALSELDRETRNVVTLEDPVEYALPGASQVQVDRRAGLGFAEALRAVLRQDPDVVMIGEIRDRETAEIAMARRSPVTWSSRRSTRRMRPARSRVC